MVNGSVVQIPSQVPAQGLALAPLTPPAHELEQPHPLYGQPHIQVQHGVLVKAPPGAGSHLTTLSHPGTPPDTPPVSASPPPMHLHRLERDHRERASLLHLHQPGSLVQDEMQVASGGMGWLTQSLRQEPLDLRPHCPQDQTPEPHGEPWHANPSHHHFQDGQHLPRHARLAGEFIFLIFFYLFPIIIIIIIALRENDIVRSYTVLSTIKYGSPTERLYFAVVIYSFIDFIINGQSPITNN